MQFPVDQSVWMLAQDFGAASVRHQGRYHTGEDWALPGGAALGQVLVAPATGRVVFSSANAWGGDGGVIILEHTFPDNSVAYSMFGHLSEAGGIRFPAALGCVRVGEPLATVADVRPVPHMHFEIRVGDNITPGQGYTWDDPQTAGLRRPTKFIANQALRLSDAYRWHGDFTDEAGPFGAPVLLDDYSLIYLDGGRVNRLTYDGRLFWRTPLASQAVGLFPAGDGAWVLYADGRWQQVLRDGALADTVETGLPLARPLLTLPNQFVVQLADGRMAAFDQAGTPLWQSAESMPPVIAAAHEPGSGRLAFMARDVRGAGHLLLTGAAGGTLNRTALAEPAPIAFAPSGYLWTFTRDGLWWIDPAGQWSLAGEAAPGGASAALAFAPDGGRVQFDGAALIAYNADGSARWQAAPGPVSGQNSLLLLNDRLLLASTTGQLIVWRWSDGAECGRARLWGGPAAWVQLHSDGLLRVYIADQLAALDWATLTEACG